MNTRDYQQAIATAEKELEAVNEKINALLQRQAQLQQSILGLKALVGEQADDDTSLTDKIRTIIRASGKPINASEVLDGLRAMNPAFGEKKQAASVTAILARMVKEKEIGRLPRKDGALGYMSTSFMKRR